MNIVQSRFTTSDLYIGKLFVLSWLTSTGKHHKILPSLQLVDRLASLVEDTKNNKLETILGAYQKSPKELLRRF